MKRYLHLSLACLALLAAAVGGFNFWADPYSIYRFDSADVERLNRINQIFTMRLSKPWQVNALRPRAVVIGSSRSASIRPRHPNWRDAPSFNLSMPGLTLYEMRRLIEHSHARGGLEKLVIGLEHETFVLDGYRTGIGFAEGRLPGANWRGDNYLQLLLDVRDTLFTGSASTRSLQAWLTSPQTSHLYRPDGSWENRSQIWLGEPGYVFIGRRMKERPRGAEAVLRDNLASLGGILGFCHRNGIDTRLYVSPEHLILSELRRQLGRDEAWRDFHRQLVSLNETVAQDHGRTAFPLWGFNQLRGIVDEPLPRGTGNFTSWFRDGIHFDPKLGVVLMEQLWGGGAETGRRLEPGKLSAYFSEVDAMTRELVGNQADAVGRYRRKILGNASAGAAPLAMTRLAQCQGSDCGRPARNGWEFRG